MKKILFVCHGNICRSPMAEFVMKDMAAKAGAGERVVIDSAATSTEELGNPVYPPARRELAAHGVVCGPHTARQMTRADYDKYDLLIGMDSANIRNMTRICGGDPAGKIHRLLDYTARPGDVADPWYTGDFSATWRDVAEGCRGLLKAITSQSPRKPCKNIAFMCDMCYDIKGLFPSSQVQSERKECIQWENTLVLTASAGRPVSP